MFSTSLPFLSTFYDYNALKMQKRREFTIAWIIKAIFIFAYLTLQVFAILEYQDAEMIEFKIQTASNGKRGKS